MMHSTVTEDRSQQNSSRLSWKLLLCIAAVALVVRVAYMITFETWNFKHEWAFGHEMGRIGQWLAQGKGFTLDGSFPTAKFPPLYPLLVGGVFYLFGAYSKMAAVSLFVFQSVCSALIAVCLAKLGDRFFNRTAGVIAGLVWAFYPTSIFYSVVRIWYSELAVLFVLVIITIVVATQIPPGFSRVVSLGALSGLTVLTDSTMALYLPLLLLWMLFARRVQLSKLIILVAVWGITAGVVTSPWMIRNWLALGSPVLLKSNVGMEFFFGNNSGKNKWSEIRKKFAALHDKDPANGSAQSEIAFNRYLRNKALEWIREHPLEFISLTARRMSQFWAINPKLGSESSLRLAYFGPILLLALWGVSFGVGRQWQLAPIWLFLLIYPLPYYLTHVDRGRYCYPVEPFVVLLAAIPVTIWFGRNARAVSLLHVDAPSQSSDKINPYATSR